MTVNPTSTTFSELLKIKERLKINLSGSQISTILDDLLYEALKYIILYTDFVENYIVELLPVVSTNKRRKFASIDREAFINNLFSFIVIKDKSIKVKLLRSCFLERNIIYDCIEEFFEKSKQYTQLYQDFLLTSNLEKKLEIRAALLDIESRVLVIDKSRMNLFCILQNVKAYYDNTQIFKSMIVEKYIRLAYNESCIAAKSTGLNVDPLELFKNLILSISKAIDKYNPEKGALTSYIKWWFMDGTNQTNNTHEYGIAFSVPNPQRRRILSEMENVFNFSISLEKCWNVVTNEETVENILVFNQNEENISLLIKEVDKPGFAMLTLGINYVLSEKEKQQLRKTLV